MSRICRNIALRSALIFMFWGAAWIMLSDRILYYIGDRYHLSAEVLIDIQGIKGTLFVLSTSIILYAVIRSGERKLRDAKKDYRDLFRKNPTAMFIFEMNTGQMFAMNEAACRQYGYDHREMNQLKVDAIHPSGQRAELERRLRDAVTDLSDLGIWKHRKRNGQDLWVRLYSRKVNFHGADARLVLAFDVDEEIVTKERLLHRTHQLSDIAWYQSHGLRAPIATILGLLNIYNYDQPASPENLEVLVRLKQSGESLDLMVRELSRKTTNPVNYPDLHEMEVREMHGIHDDALNLQRAPVPPHSLL
jgi:PAS domain S-box-containing protein